MQSAADQSDSRAPKVCAEDRQPIRRRLTTIDDLPDELIVKILAQSKVCGCGWAMAYPLLQCESCCTPCAAVIWPWKQSHSGQACAAGPIYSLVSASASGGLHRPLAGATSARHSTAPQRSVLMRCRAAHAAFADDISDTLRGAGACSRSPQPSGRTRRCVRGATVPAAAAAMRRTTPCGAWSGCLRGQFTVTGTRLVSFSLDMCTQNRKA